MTKYSGTNAVYWVAKKELSLSCVHRKLSPSSCFDEAWVHQKRLLNSPLIKFELFPSPTKNLYGFVIVSGVQTKRPLLKLAFQSKSRYISILSRLFLSYCRQYWRGRQGQTQSNLSYKLVFAQAPNYISLSCIPTRATLLAAKPYPLPLSLRFSAQASIPPDRQLIDFLIRCCRWCGLPKFCICALLWGLFVLLWVERPVFRYWWVCDAHRGRWGRHEQWPWRRGLFEWCFCRNSQRFPWKVRGSDSSLGLFVGRLVSPPQLPTSSPVCDCWLFWRCWGHLIRTLDWWYWWRWVRWVSVSQGARFWAQSFSEWLLIPRCGCACV